MQAAIDQGARVLSWDQLVALLEPLAAQARRRQGSLSLLLLSVGGVESGLEARATAALADLLQQTVRQGDMIGRHGERSFAVLAADTPQAGAVLLAQRVHGALQARPLAPGVPLGSASIGIATLPEAGITGRAILQQAETALAEAAAAGGNRARLAGWDGPEAWLFWEFERDRSSRQRQASRMRLARAFERGWIPYVRIQTRRDACPACLNAARDPAPPGLLPELPLVGCASVGGCRCRYASPVLETRPAAPSVQIEDAAALRIPRSLRSAAFFGADSRQRCSPADLADYLEQFPMLHVASGLDLPMGELVYLARPAEQAWERPGALGPAAPGIPVPVELPLQPWLKRLGKPTAIPSRALQGSRTGTLYLTSRRILFDDGATINSLPLLQISDLEYLSDAIACRVDQWQNRLVFRVDAPLLVSLSVARAMRSELLLG